MAQGNSTVVCEPRSLLLHELDSDRRLQTTHCHRSVSHLQYFVLVKIRNNEFSTQKLHPCSRILVPRPVRVASDMSMDPQRSRLVGVSPESAGQRVYICHPPSNCPVSRLQAYPISDVYVSDVDDAPLSHKLCYSINPPSGLGSSIIIWWDTLVKRLRRKRRGG